MSESPHIGPFVVIDPDARVESGARIGAFSSIHAGARIAPGAVIGERVTIRSGARVDEGAEVGDGCLVGADAHISRGARLRPGTVLEGDVPNNAVVAGNPAAIVDYVSTNDDTAALPVMVDTSSITERTPLRTGGCFLEPVPNFADVRGSLTALEEGKGVPFEPKRVFLVYGVGSQFVRGEHAHHECAQFLVAANGGLSVMIDDGTHREEVRLSDKSVGLLLAPGTWGVQYKFTPDCILMVLASHPYENADYIRDYDEFLALKADRT